MRNLILLLIAILTLSILPDDSLAQFRDRGPGGDALRYNGWLQKQHSFRGYRPTRKELKNMGKKPSEVRKAVRQKNKSVSLIQPIYNHEKPNRIITRSAIRINHGHNHSSGNRISPEGQNLGTVFQIDSTTRRTGEFSLCDTSGSLNPNSSERACLLRENRGYNFTPERPAGIQNSGRKNGYGNHQGSTGQIREILPDGIS